jgi:flagellar basal body P-ring formation protein FlgA
VVVRLWRSSLVAAASLPAGSTLEPGHLRVAEVDLLARPDAVLNDIDTVRGRTLAQPLVAGQALRLGDLRLRQWVRPGDTVRVLAGGPGFTIMAEAQALVPALEGQPVRVRTEAGRVLQGVATAERQVTVPL